MNKSLILIAFVALLVAVCAATKRPVTRCFTARSSIDCAGFGNKCSWVALGDDERGFCKMSHFTPKQFHAYEAEQVQALETERKMRLLDQFLEDSSLLEVDNEFVTTHYLRELDEIQDQEELFAHYKAILNHKRGHRVPRNATRREEDGQLIQILPIIITPSFSYLQEGEEHFEYDVTQFEVQVLDEEQRFPKGFDIILPHEEEMAFTGDVRNCTFNGRPVSMFPIRSTEDVMNEDYDPDTEIQIHRGLHVPVQLTANTKNIIKCIDLRYISVKAPKDGSTIVQYSAQTFSTDMEIMHLVSQPSNFKERLADNKAWLFIGAIAFAVIVLIIIGVGLHFHSRKLSTKKSTPAPSTTLPEEEQSLLSAA